MRAPHGAGLLLAILLGAGCETGLDDGASDDDEVLDQASAGILVGGVEIAIPSPFTGKVVGNRRVEFPLGLTMGSGASTVSLPPGDTLDPMLAELGNLLFFDKRLSKGGVMSCATCHQPAMGYSAVDFSRGVDGNTLPRTSPSSLNRLWGTDNNWVGFNTLEEMSSAPILSAAEMGLTPTQLVNTVGGVPGYADRFQRLVAAGVLTAPAVSVANIERAIATFQRLTLMTGDSSVDRFEAGDPTALTAEQQAGRRLFHTKARCVTCHSGPNYTDEAFHHVVSTVAPGRMEVTGEPADAGKFKTPSLRNVALRGPYFHNGGTVERASCNSSGCHVWHPTRVSTLAHAIHRYNIGPMREPGAEFVALGLSSTEKLQLQRFLEGLSGSIPNDPRLSTQGSWERENIYLSPAVFDEVDYAARYPDLTGMTSMQLRNHWLTVGIREGRRGVATFDVKEYLNLYPAVFDALGGLPNQYQLAIDHYLNLSRRLGWVGRYALHGAFFSAIDYRALNGRATALLSEAKIIEHRLGLGLTGRLPSRTRPTGYFIRQTPTVTSFHYADGTTTCTFADGAALKANRGRADFVGVPRFAFLPPNLKDGGACVTTTSPPTPTRSAPPPSGTLVAFACQATNSNAGCSSTAICPSGTTIKSVRAGCNLEFGTESQSRMERLPWATQTVWMPSDNSSEGHCRLGQMDIATDSVRAFLPSPVISCEVDSECVAHEDRITFGCSEHDDNGGDCHILGQLLCAP